jgi:hypothetical protein
MSTDNTKPVSTNNHKLVAKPEETAVIIQGKLDGTIPFSPTNSSNLVAPEEVSK